MNSNDTTKKLFIRYLKKNNIYPNFIKQSYKRYNTNNNRNFNLVFNQSSVKPCEYINYCLTWDLTTEGWHFWNDHYNNFYQLYLKYMDDNYLNSVEKNQVIG